MQKLLVAAVTIFVASCGKNIPLHSDVCAPVACQPIYGRESDWNLISDDLARNIYKHNKMCEIYLNQG